MDVTAPKPGTRIHYLEPKVVEYRQNNPHWNYLLLAPGEMAVINDEWWLRCPCGMLGTLEHEVTLTNERITVFPDVKCPGGCRYQIRDGVIHEAS